MSKNEIIENLIDIEYEKINYNQQSTVRYLRSHLRYETLRNLNLLQIAKLQRRNLEGENFDGMIDEIIIANHKKENP